MAATSKKAMELLHVALAEQMKVILEEGVTAVDKDGDVVKLTPGANYLNAIRQFLKDNNIDTAAEKSGSVQSLKAAALPFLQKMDDDEDEYAN